MRNGSGAAFGISTYGFRNEILTTRRLAEVHAAGFRHIELLANRPHFDYYDRRVLGEITDWFAATPTGRPSLHLPFREQTGPRSFRWISGLAPEEHERQAARDEMKRALELTDRLPVSRVVLHLGVPGQPANPLHVEYAYALVDMIRSFAGVDVLIENIPNDTSTPEWIAEFIRIAELPETGICYDTGHGHLQSSPLSLERVGAIHLNDNEGSHDQHLWPFEGTIDWVRLAAAIVKSEFDGPLVIEGPTPDLNKALEVADSFNDLLVEARSSREAFDFE
jgi:hypothetical protein